MDGNKNTDKVVFPKVLESKINQRFKIQFQSFGNSWTTNSSSSSLTKASTSTSSVFSTSNSSTQSSSTSFFSSFLQNSSGSISSSTNNSSYRDCNVWMPQSMQQIMMIWIRKIFQKMRPVSAGKILENMYFHK